MGSLLSKSNVEKSNIKNVLNNDKIIDKILEETSQDIKERISRSNNLKYYSAIIEITLDGSSYQATYVSGPPVCAMRIKSIFVVNIEKNINDKLLKYFPNHYISVQYDESISKVIHFSFYVDPNDV